MTTPRAAAAYLAEHEAKVQGRGLAVFNPHNKPESELSIIYGFNNGGHSGWWSGQLLAEDGAALGGHVCSDEGYMPHDLGILEGSRPDRHETFRTHYPDGYRMIFLGLEEAKTDVGLEAAYQRNQARQKATEGKDTTT